VSVRPDGAAIIGTEAFLRTLTTIREISEQRLIGAVYGDPGLGKTFAVKSALDQLEGVTVCNLQMPERATPRVLTMALINALTGVIPKGERFLLQQELIEILRGEHRLLVVDEAQYLQRQSIEALRFLHDDTETDFGLVLVGGHGCFETISRYPMLKNRTKRWVEFPPIADIEIPPVMASYHPLLADTPTELLLEIDERFGRGVWRNWEAFLFDAIASCEEHDLDTVNEFVMRDVFERQRGGREAA
jgi:hypothetical protein